MHGVADYRQKAIRLGFMRAIRELVNETTLAEIQRAFESGDLARAEAAIPWDDLPLYLTDMAEGLVETLQNAAEVSRKYVPDEITFRLRFDLLNPQSVEYIRSYRFELIRELADQSREAIRGVIQRAFEDGMHPRVAARHIRDIIGLTERQALAIDNLRRKLKEDGLPMKRIEEITERYARRFQRERALSIARTETIRAANAGQQLLWQQAQQQGLVDAIRTYREWIVTPDDKLCEYCLKLDGVRVGLNEPFNTDFGLIMHPPMHPNCRCAVALHTKD